MKKMSIQNNKRLLKLIYTYMFVLLLTVLSACGKEINEERNDNSSGDAEVIEDTLGNEIISGAPVIDGLTCIEKLPLDYAVYFDIYRYEGGYSLICVGDGRSYLVIPENADIPENIDDYFIIRKPLNNIYLASSASMALFDSMNALDTIGMTSLEADAWYVDNVRQAMEDEEILFAGKYSEPDYELLLDEECLLAIENTMILHTPEIQEKLEELGITVFIDCSSYEDHPLARTEWIKVYAELTDRQDEALSFFEEQKKYVTELSDYESTGKTVAYFYVSESGSVIVRKSEDYIPKMIEIAGGDYIFDDLGSDEASASSSTNVTMEEFYNTAKDVDYLIYNSTIDNPLHSVDELIEKNALFTDFKAVQNDNVWCTEKNMFQATDVIGSIINDFHTVFTDENAEKLDFMYRIH